MNKKTKVAVSGTMKDGFVISIKEKKKVYDLQLSPEEMSDLVKILKKKKLV